MSEVLAMERPVNERAKEVTHLWANLPGIGMESFGRFLSSLPEFNPPKEKWIRCSERMPEDNDFIWYFDHNPKTQHKIKTIYAASGNAQYMREYVSWKLCPIPALPVEEDSPLVKKIKTIPFHPTDYLTAVIEIIKRHEKESKK